MKSTYARIFVILFLIAFNILGDAVWTNHKDVLLYDHVSPRLAQITADISAASPQSIMLAGNSHAELAAHADTSSCYPKINAGISGVKASKYATSVKNIKTTVQLHAAVLMIGTNEITWQENPLDEASKSRFVSNVNQILQWLKEATKNIIVIAVPPIGRAATKWRDPSAIPVYSRILEQICYAQRCRFVDPFQSVRDGDSGLAHDSVFSDAIHLLDYAWMMKEIGACQ